MTDEGLESVRGIPVHEPGHVAPANPLIYSEKVRRGEQPEFDKEIDEPRNRSWRPFQIAFILLNLPGVTKLDHLNVASVPKPWLTYSFFPQAAARRKPTWPISLHDESATFAGNRCGKDGGRGRGRVDAVHVAITHDSAVPAGHGSDLCLRVDSP